MSMNVYPCLFYGFILDKVDDELYDKFWEDEQKDGVIINYAENLDSYQVYVKSSHIVADTDDGESVNLTKHLKDNLEGDCDHILRKFCNKTGLKYDNPGWILSSDWY